MKPLVTVANLLLALVQAALAQPLSVPTTGFVVAEGAEFPGLFAVGGGQRSQTPRRLVGDRA